MKTIQMVNLKVVVLDTDYYSLQAINSYLAWDRRTRVTHLSETPDELIRYLSRVALAERPDVLVIDADHMGGASGLTSQINRARKLVPDLMVICLAQFADTDLIDAAVEAGARGILLKSEIRAQLAWAIVFALDHPFIVTGGIAAAGERVFSHRLMRPVMLPRQRQYPELTERIRQAIELCVVKGMPAQLAADEMGISLHTIRSYIKEGYRILEAYDDTEYPVDMSPQERAFMRLTSFQQEEE